MIYFFSAIVLLGVLITIHEFGHFIVARYFGVYVQRFSIGMGPVFYKKHDKQGTEFALSALPLGGYVAMLSDRAIAEDESILDGLSKEQLANTFESKPKWQRALIMLAGPIANFLLAIIVFAIIYSNSVERQFDATVVLNETSKIENQYTFEGGDVLEFIEGKKINNLQDLRLELLSHSGKSGFINLGFKDAEGNRFEEAIEVNNFLSDESEQINPENALGFLIDLKLRPYIGQIADGLPVASSGLQVNDLILSVESQPIKYFDDIREVIASSRSVIQIEVLRDSQRLYFDVELSKRLVEGVEQNYIGIVPGTRLNIIESIVKGAKETYNMSYKTITFIGKMLSGNLGTQNLSGPIGIVQMAGDTAKAGIIPFLYLMALLSISLGVLNLLPIPVLDGGQLVLLGVEAINRGPIPEKVENVIYSSGWALVMLLMFFAIFNDISRFF
jgi:regulator of sigma E protease